MDTARIVLFSILLSCSLSLSSQDHTEVVRESSMRQDTILANTYIKTFEQLSGEGAYTASVPYMEQAQVLYQKHQLWEKYIESLLELAYVSSYIDEHQQLKYAMAALSHAKHHLEPQHVFTARAYKQIGEVKFVFEELDSSNYYYAQAAPIFEKAADWDNLAWCKILTALNYYYLGKYAEGKSILEEPYWQEQQFNNEDILPMLYDLKGVFYFTLGDIEKSKETLEASLDLSLQKELVSAADSSHVANHFNNLGTIFSTKGDPQRALDYFLQAETFYSNEDNDLESRVIIFNNIGRLYFKKGDYKKAIRYFKNNINLISSKGTPPQYLDNLDKALRFTGAVYTDMGVYDSAQYYFKKNIDLLERHNRPMVYTEILFSQMLLKLNEPIKALDYLSRIRKAVLHLEDASSIEPVIYFRIGEAYTQLAQYDTALVYFQKSLVSNDTTFSGTESVSELPLLNTRVYEPIYFLDALVAKAETLSKLSGQEGNLSASLETYLQAIAWTDSLRKMYVLEDNELFWGERYRKIYEAAVHTAYQCYEQSGDIQYINTAFALSEKSKATLLLHAFNVKTGDLRSGVPKSLLEKERDLSLNMAFYEKALAEAQTTGETAKAELYKNYFTQSKLDLARLKEKIEKDYPDYYALKHQGQELDINHLQQSLLDDETALLEYFIGAKQSYLFLLYSGQLEMIILPDIQALMPKIDHFNQVLFDITTFLNNPKQASQRYNDAAYSLYNILLKGVLDQLPPTINRLILIPEGVLSTIPFEALNTKHIAESDGSFNTLPYVLKKYNLHYGYSSGLLLKNKERQQQLPTNSQCLAFAPPYQSDDILVSNDVRANQVRNGINSLNHTPKEINDIQQYFSGYFDASVKATKAQFLEKAPNYGLLHLAMHGEADFNHNKFGHLIFTNTSSDKQADYLLYHYEIANLKFDAQLAVLSACETGVGKYEAGEGVFSLARSFMYAGVPSIVMSLWKVNDQSTSWLMPAFYKHLSTGQAKDEALRQAKMEFLLEADPLFHHPFYWSGFVVLGDPQPLKHSFSVWPILLGIGTLLILLGIWWWKRSH
jgi:CHAT domain-containing protein/tetratricopeptide (TPR) repeat protein